MAICKKNAFVLLFAALLCLFALSGVRGFEGQTIKCATNEDCLPTCLDPNIRCVNGFCLPCPSPTKVRCKVNSDCQEWCLGRVGACRFGKCECRV